MKQIYIIFEGTFFKESYVKAVCTLKKEAARLCRNNGEYKYNKKEDLYKNERENRFRRIDIETLNPETIW